MLRVAFGVTALARGRAGQGLDGIGNVTSEIMRRLPADPAVELLPFVYARDPDPAIPGCIGVGDFGPQAMTSLVTGLPFLRMQRTLHGRIDLVHATDHFIPRLRGIPVLATLMDAIPLAHPEWVSYRFRSLKHRMWRRSARWADHVVTISEWSRREIVRWFGIPEDRISVIPLGVDAGWFVEPPEAAKRLVRERYRLPESFFLFVGTMQPRKNLDRLIQAHGGLPRDIRAAFPLVVVGRHGWGCETLAARLRADTVPDLRWLEYVPDEDLRVLMHLGSALVFPSLCEGFGLPVLEAFAAGLPVIASNTTALPEVAGDAALLVDPFDMGGWREAMMDLALTPGSGESLRERGRARVRAFDWEDTVVRTRTLYGQVAGR